MRMYRRRIVFMLMEVTPIFVVIFDCEYCWWSVVCVLNDANDTFRDNHGEDWCRWLKSSCDRRDKW